MATIKDLFKQQNKDLYGLSGKIIIESRGVINPPRAAALLTSSPQALADMIGNQIGGVLQGSANRPSDTIFKTNTPFAKPITLGKTQRQIKDAIEAEETYYIKQDPAPASIFAKLKQGGTSPLGMLGNAAIGALNKFGSKKGLEDIKKYREELKNQANDIKLAANKATRPDGKVQKAKKLGSDYEPIFGINRDKGHTFPTVVGWKESKNTHWDVANTFIQNNLHLNDADTKTIESSNYTYMKIKVLGETDSVHFNGTISGINETVTPEWNTYKYIGSPFKVYTYGGVERSLSFDFKLYCTSRKEKDIMLQKLNYLTSLAYPYKQLSNVRYNETATQQTMFAPNFIFLTIKSFYNNMFGFVDNLSFTIDDNVSWANFEGVEKDEADTNKESTPSIINVQFGMKIVDSKNTLGYDNKDNQFKYNFRNQKEIK
jgi:predicted double-glycine peptidase